MEACTNPEILKVIYFFLLIIDIIKIVIPIGLIVISLIDFSKSVISSDEKVQKKTVNLFVKRLLYAVLVFAVPWIVEVIMVTLGDILSEEVNFTDCIDNANNECIEALDSNTIENIHNFCDVTDEDTSETRGMCYYCVVKNKFTWSYGSAPSKFDCAGIPWTEKTEMTEEECKNETSNGMCYYCVVKNKFTWSYGSAPSKLDCAGTPWTEKPDIEQKDCN